MVLIQVEAGCENTIRLSTSNDENYSCQIRFAQVNIAWSHTWRLHWTLAKHSVFLNRSTDLIICTCLSKLHLGLIFFRIAASLHLVEQTNAPVNLQIESSSLVLVRASGFREGTLTVSFNFDYSNDFFLSCLGVRECMRSNSTSEASLTIEVAQLLPCSITSILLFAQR